MLMNSGTGPQQVCKRDPRAKPLLSGLKLFFLPRDPALSSPLPLLSRKPTETLWHRLDAEILGGLSVCPTLQLNDAAVEDNAQPSPRFPFQALFSPTLQPATPNSLDVK